MSAPRIEDPQTGATYTVRRDRPTVVGRRSASSMPDIACASRHVSRKHCELIWEEERGLRVVDRSTHGVFLNGERIAATAFAQPGDSIRLSEDYVLLVVVPLAEARSETPSQAPPAGSPGALLDGRYRIEAELGQGCLGPSYKAVDASRAGPCVVKLLTELGPASDVTRARVTRRRTAGAPALPGLRAELGLIPVRDLGCWPEDERLYCVLDYMEGISLRHCIAEGYPRGLLTPVLVQVADALALAHGRGVVHRDLRPGNVLLTSDAEVRVLEVGLSTLLEEVALLRPGQVLTRAEFLAPEQVTNGPVGPASDVYALGAILYAVLTRRPPFSGDSLTEVVARVAQGALVPPRELDASISEELDALCRSALAKAPDARPASAEAFAAALRPLVRSPRRELGATRT